MHDSWSFSTIHVVWHSLIGALAAEAMIVEIVSLKADLMNVLIDHVLTGQ